jgi:hypothetical protein
MYSRIFVSKNTLAPFIQLFAPDRTRIDVGIGPAFGDMEYPLDCSSQTPFFI